MSNIYVVFMNKNRFILKIHAFSAILLAKTNVRDAKYSAFFSKLRQKYFAYFLRSCQTLPSNTNTGG